MSAIRIFWAEPGIRRVLLLFRSLPDPIGRRPQHGGGFSVQVLAGDFCIVRRIRVYPSTFRN